MIFRFLRKDYKTWLILVQNSFLFLYFLFKYYFSKIKYFFISKTFFKNQKWRINAQSIESKTSLNKFKCLDYLIFLRLLSIMIIVLPKIELENILKTEIPNIFLFLNE